jgi:hypothetical protein
MGVSFITIGANRREDKDNSWALDDPMARGWKCQTKHNYFVKLPEGFGQRPFNKRWSDGALSEEASKQFWQGYRMIRYAYQRWSGHFFLLAIRESALWGYWAICTPSTHPFGASGVCKSPLECNTHEEHTHTTKSTAMIIKRQLQQA